MFELILFDLDATLLPMDQDEFVREYMRLLSNKFEPLGYEKKSFIQAIWKGTAAMVRNDGSCPNEERFWNEYAAIFGEDALKYKPVFDEFYANEFENARVKCGYNPAAAETVRALKAKGCRVVLATNPLFPAIATNRRIDWAGLSPEDFELITTYENSRFCKPEPRYYVAIAESLGVNPKNCLMVGNDVDEDMIAETVGMSVFLLTDCLINRNGKDISVYPHGSFKELMEYVEK